MHTQTEDDREVAAAVMAQPAVALEAPPAALAATEAQLPRPLIYAALLGSKSEATEAIKGLMAKVNEDHAGLPHTIFFWLHSDRGTEFVNRELAAKPECGSLLR